MGILKWISSVTLSLADPRRQDRINGLAAAAWKGITERRSRFDLRRMMIEMQGNVDDMNLVAEKVYENALIRAWKDLEISDRERASLDIIREIVHLSAKQTRTIDRQVGLRVFEAALGEAIVDGDVSSDEIQRLTKIAMGMGRNLRDLMLQHFRGQGEGFLQNSLAGMMQDGQFTGVAWNKLAHTAGKLGFSTEEIQKAVRPQAERLVNHVLADAKSDESISDEEASTINWLLDTFGLSPAFRTYVQNELDAVIRLERIRSGNLPVVEAIDVSLRAGEVAHAQCPATYLYTRQLSSGERTYRHEGEVVITDYRMLFSGDTKSFGVTHRRIISIIPINGGVEIRTSGKGSGIYLFRSENHQYPIIYEVAIGKANQTVVSKLNGVPSRHIPRDVRQRVWQRYGGVCVDCGDNRYLEFDHIIPIAKGGSNSDNNIQLLCRGCNGKKSDMI